MLCFYNIHVETIIMEKSANLPVDQQVITDTDKESEWERLLLKKLDV